MRLCGRVPKEKNQSSMGVLVFIGAEMLAHVSLFLSTALFRVLFQLG